MICLRCGHCCIHYDVMVLRDSHLGINDNNIIHKPTGEKCLHLIGDEPGEHKCAIHGSRVYKQTPCFSFGQIERNKKCECRMGRYILDKGLERV